MKNLIFAITLMTSMNIIAEEMPETLSCLPEYMSQLSYTGSAGMKFDGGGSEGIRTFYFKSNEIKSGFINEENILEQQSYKIQKLSDRVYKGIDGVGSERIYIFSNDNAKLSVTSHPKQYISTMYYRCN